jgi:peptidoglycan/xylan/chitin deacetylase (PgdA/CDA1 family)
MKPSSYGPFKYIPLPDRPRLVWPGEARVALWIAPNIEFFGLDSNVPSKDNERIAPDKAWMPSVRNWAVRDYGNRVGIWRIFDVMHKHGIRGTAPLNSRICDEHPRIIDTALQLGWEFMGHNQTNSVRCVDVPADKEREEIKATLDRIEKAAGRRPVGWLGAGTAETWNTVDHLVAENCRYVGDWQNDEQPYVMTVSGKRLVSIPYTAEINDVTCYFNHALTPDEYEKALKRHFDVLYRDGAKTGRVMGIPIHPFITGSPQRIDAFDSALGYMLSHAGVWRATGSEIVDFYLESPAAI